MKKKGTATLFIVFFIIAFSPFSSSARPIQKKLLPREIQGAWKFGTDRCLINATPDSDGVMVIYRKYIHSNEEVIFPREISLISKNPTAWRLVGISNIAPVDVQGQAEIYVLKNKTLTVTDGETVRQYVKCD